MEGRQSLNEIYAAYIDWMRTQSPWRWDESGKLVHPPVLNIVNYLSKIGSRLQTTAHDGQARIDGKSSRIAIGFCLMQIYLIWSQHKAHQGVDFHGFIEIMERVHPAKMTELTRYRLSGWLIRHILRFPKMRDRFNLIFGLWPMGGYDMGICVREAWATIRGGTEQKPELCFLARMPNMVQ